MGQRLWEPEPRQAGDLLLPGLLKESAKKTTRHARDLIRTLRRNDLAGSKLDAEIRKAESVINLRNSLLQELAIYENNFSEPSSDMKADTIGRMKRTLEKTKREIMEALKTLV